MIGRRRTEPLSAAEWRRVGGMTLVVALFHALGWGVFVFAILPAHYKLLGFGVAVTAYTLGLRHAFDADHISAIDNTTRKLMAEGKRPLSVGFFFLLGHSSIVVALGVALTIATKGVFHAVRDPHSALQSFGGVFGTAISGSFLYLIAAINVVILVGITRIFFAMRRGIYEEDELENQLQGAASCSGSSGSVSVRSRSPGRCTPSASCSDWVSTRRRRSRSSLRRQGPPSRRCRGTR